MLYAVTQFSRKLTVSPGILILLYLYILYVAFKSEVSYSLVCLIMIVHLTAIAKGAINIDSLRLYLERIACIAAIGVIIQQAVHISTGIHIPLINTNYIIDGLADSAIGANTGYHSHELMYRPSGFFMEPAHMTQYCIVGLTSALFRSREISKQALIISLGVLMSTSGMGMVLVLCDWVLWYYLRKTTNLSQFKISVGQIVVILCIAFLAYFILMQIDFFAEILGRFMKSEDDGADYNAINGRLFWWDTFFAGHDPIEFLWGFGREALPENTYFTGFMTVLYAFGILGVVLMALLLVVCKV